MYTQELLLLRFILNLFGLIYLVPFSHAYAANDPYLFEKDGFRIHYVGTGGNCVGCEWIAVDGKLPPDAGELFQQYVIRHNLKNIRLYVDLNSEGGSLVGGIRLGRVIRSLGMNTSVAKTVPDDQFYRTEKGVCLSACAYAFLGGVTRSVDAGGYGVHQFFTDALLKDPTGKVFSPVDFSVQQTLTGLLLSYVIEMGVSAELVVEANKTAPTEMNFLTKKQLTEFRVSFDPKRYGDWVLESFRNGIIAYSRTQDQKNQMTLLCYGSHRAELLITYYQPAGERNNFKAAFDKIQKFSLLERDIPRTAIKWDNRPIGTVLHVPLGAEELNALELNTDLYGSFSVHLDEPRVFHSYIYEQISLGGLATSVRLVRRNCVN